MDGWYRENSSEISRVSLFVQPSAYTALTQCQRQSYPHERTTGSWWRETERVRVREGNGKREREHERVRKGRERERVG
jgi:hypothetical protein